MRPNAHIVKRRFTGIQVTITIPRHIAQATGLWGSGFVAFQVDATGRVYIQPHPQGTENHANATTADLLDRSAA